MRICRTMWAVNGLLVPERRPAVLSCAAVSPSVWSSSRRLSIAKVSGSVLRAFQASSGIGIVRLVVCPPRKRTCRWS